MYYKLINYYKLNLYFFWYLGMLSMFIDNFIFDKNVSWRKLYFLCIINFYYLCLCMIERNVRLFR